MLVGVVCGQQRGNIDVDREQVPDGRVILSSIETVERLAATRVGTGQCHRVDLRLQPFGEGMVGGLVGSRAAGRRHRLGAQFDEHALPCLGVGRHM